MPIRWKILILLLGMSLMPLLFVSGYGLRSTHELGLGLTERGSKIAIERYSLQLSQMLEQSAALLRIQKTLVELSLKVQAMEAEKKLAAPAPKSPLVFFDRHYDSKNTPPPGLVTSSRHIRASENGNPRPMKISLDHQVIRLAPGVAADSVSEDIARLSAMTASYRDLYQTKPDLYYWQYTSLESGVHSSYPGHGGYPPTYDGRKRPWYKIAKKTGKMDWSPPLLDATTRKVLLTVSMPVRRPGGAFAGVTAIDVQIIPILQQLRVRSALSANAKTFLAGVMPGGGGQGKGIHVIAHQEYGGRGADWQATIKMDWLESGSRAQTVRLIENMERGRSGLLRMPHRGRDALWAYRAIDNFNTYLLFVVPFDDVTADFSQLRGVVESETGKQILLVAAGSVVMILFVIAASFYSSQSVTAPVGNLAAAARRIAEGDFEARTNVKSKDELGELGTAFNEMVPHLEDRMKVRQALTMAREVQQSFLPAGSPELPGFDIAGHSQYSDETGGDYYDFIDLSGPDGNRLGVAVGDVSGHELASSLLMATVRALLRSQSAQPGGIGRHMSYINDYLARDSIGGRFMTMFYIVIDAESREARWVNAGHDAAIVYNPAEETFEELTAVDIPLGIKTDWNYREFSRQDWLDERILLIGTDGIWETRNERGEMFGKEAAGIIVRRNAGKSASAICGAIDKALGEFRGASKPLDDTTIVVIKGAP